MAYRAPELFDVKTGQTLDEKVDIWVRYSPDFQLQFCLNLTTTVIGLHIICPRIFTLAL